MDGFTAGPATPPTASRLASSWNAAFAFAFAFAFGFGFGLAQVEAATASAPAAR